MGANGGGAANGGLGHLLPEVAALIGRPVEERVWFARQDKWIGYPHANKALAAMRDLVNQPKQQRRTGILVAGRANNGKSALLKRFLAENPVITNEDGTANFPFVLAEMPPKADETRLWSELLLAMRVPHRHNDHVQHKRNTAIQVLDRIHCEVVGFDEVHNVLLGHAAAQRQLLAVLKNLVNVLSIPMIVAGTPDAIRALSTDPQVSTRFEIQLLPKWDLNGDFLRLLASFEAVLPLAEPSNLASRETAMKLFQLSSSTVEGEAKASTIGGLTNALKKATVLALREGRERIDLALLNRLDVVTVAEYGAKAAAL